MDKNKVSEASFLVLAEVPSSPHGPASFRIPLGLLAPLCPIVLSFLSLKPRQLGPVKTFPFRTRSSEDAAEPPQSACAPWTKAELRAIIKDLPRVTEGPHRGWRNSVL